jgi:hypothetical protein
MIKALFNFVILLCCHLPSPGYEMRPKPPALPGHFLLLSVGGPSATSGGGENNNETDDRLGEAEIPRNLEGLTLLFAWILLALLNLGAFRWNEEFAIWKIFIAGAGEHGGRILSLSAMKSQALTEDDAQRSAYTVYYNS